MWIKVGIDNPIDQAKRQFPPPSRNALFDAAIEAVKQGTGLSLRPLFDHFVENEPERIAYFVGILMDEVGRLMGVIDKVTARDEIVSRLATPEGTEALIVAVERVVRTQNQKRIRRFAQVLGTSVAEDSPDWEETQALLYDIERLTEQDFAVLTKMASAERRDLGKTGTAGPEFWSRCARLTGFGLVTAMHGTSISVLPRPSPRGARLADMLTPLEKTIQK